ncbi:SPDEF [Branchiostoma lanceolatum]|uniref:SPDEF protein n=1 Tax=Branchiostoma lanceolatum TaxID=7740 RepID=A0A8J9ZIX5_BRALA|nr:SPDEF [Branchiostoma lanceolatum]
MEAEKLSSSNHMSLPEVGVFLTPPSTPAVKQEPPAGPGTDCPRGEDGLVPVPAHQPCRQGKPCHHGSTGPPPESLQYQDEVCDVYYSPERAESPPSVFAFPSPESTSPHPDYPAQPAMLPEPYYPGQDPSPSPDTMPLTEQQPLTPRYMTENSSFEPSETQLSPVPDSDTTQMTVYEVYSNGDFRPWDQSGGIGEVGTTGVFGNVNYQGASMSPVPVETTSPAQSPPCTAPPVPCYPATYTVHSSGHSPPVVPSPRGSAPAHFSHDCGSPDPGQTFDFPAPYAVPHEANVETLRHREAMGMPPPVGPKQPDLSEQQLDRFLRQTRRELSDLLSPDDPSADRRQTGMPCHAPGMERPASPRQHVPQPGLTDRDFPRQHASQPGITDRDPVFSRQHTPQPGLTDRDFPVQHAPQPGLTDRDFPRQHAPQLSLTDRDPVFPRQHVPQPGLTDRDFPGQHAPQPGLTDKDFPRQHAPQPGLTDRDLEEVQTLIMQEVSRDIEVAFKVVQVPRDPRTWSPPDVARWLTWTADQYRLPNVYLECFPLDGAQLCDLAEREFIYRAPESGQILYALLEIWKSGMTNGGPGARSTVCTINKKPITFSNQYVPNCVSYPVQDAAPPPTEKAVHLWQFLRELLSQPEAYSRFIRWMDRGKGIFKIEDSVQVARLWGIRKSRPAMNYDKLSRSIRQYYKKGIIRKPDQAQRLVYQFVKN